MCSNKIFLKITSMVLALVMLIPVSAGAVSPVNAEIPCESAVLREGLTGKILFQKNMDKKMSPASITKIMSLLLVMEAIEDGRISLEDEVTASPHAVSMGGSQIWLKENEVMTVDELLKAAAIASANDATVALGEFIAGSEEGFVAMMNEKADFLGMKNTHFENCTGLDAEGHLTTAEDISIMAMELIKYPLIKKYSTVWMDELRGGKTQLVNTNRLVRFYKGTTGLKTGTTDDAGCCLCATAERDNLPLIAVSLGSRTSDERFKSCRGLLDFGFSGCKAVKVPSLKGCLDPVRVKRGEMREIGIEAKAPEFIVTEKGSKTPLELKAEKVPFFEAPVEKNKEAGSVKIMQDGVILSEIPLFTAYPVCKLSYIHSLKRIFSKVFSL